MRRWSGRVLSVVAVAASAVGLTQAVARGETMSGIVDDVTYLEAPSGERRVLFRIGGIPERENRLIRSATLRVPYTATGSDRTIELRVVPVTTDWSRSGVDWDIGWETPGGDFDRELYSRAFVDLGRTGSISFDLTVQLKEVFESGRELYGFLVTEHTAERDGILLDDLPVLQNLAGAPVEVSYRVLMGNPPAHRGG